MPRPPPVTTQTLPSEPRSVRAIRVRSLRHFHQLNADPVRVDHVDDLSAFDWAGVRRLYRRDEAGSVVSHAGAEFINVVHDDTEVSRSRVCIGGVYAGGIDAPVLQDLETYRAA